MTSKRILIDKNHLFTHQIDQSSNTGIVFLISILVQNMCLELTMESDQSFKKELSPNPIKQSEIEKNDNFLMKLMTLVKVLTIRKFTNGTEMA